MPTTPTIVEENNGSSDPADPDLVVPLGTRLGIQLVDLDGSQSLDLTLANIPTTAGVAFGGTVLNAGGAATISGVNVSRGAGGDTITISGANAATAITVLETLNVTLEDDNDTNFQVAITGQTVEAIGGASSPINATHDVTVQAVADTPDVEAGSATKATVQEDSGYVTYPVTIALNDTDGSETYQSVVVQFSTPGVGARPEVQFTTTAGVTIDDTSVPGQVTLTGGTTAQMEAALLSMQVRPGADNGDDITVTVTATAVESNPTEDNNGAAAGNGGGVVGPEITVPTAVNSDTFVIPVDPVPETPQITVTTPVAGTEDVFFPLSGITLSTATNDPDGSESNFLEIDTSTYPTDTVFRTGGTTHTTIVNGFLRIPEADVAGLEVLAPNDYSGTFVLDARTAVVDTSNSNTVTSFSPVSQISVGVVPVADPITGPSRTNGVEDNGPVAFGNNISNNISLGDSVVGGPASGGVLGGVETVSQLVFDVPADTAQLTYTLSGGPLPGSGATLAGVGSAEVTRTGTGTYTITSTILVGDLATLTDAQRQQASDDILATMAQYQVEIGPTHTDLDGVIAVTATALDVKDGITSTQDSSFNHTIRIRAVADTPTIAASVIGGAIDEDSGNARLAIDPGRSPDEDNSETLSVRITVPSDGQGPTGTITGTPPAGVTLSDQGGGVYLVTATGATPADREAALDGFLNGGGLEFDPRDNWAGDVDLTIESISTEAATGGQLAPGSFGGADGTSKTETVETTVTVAVNAVVDTPSVKGNAIGLEDTNIPVPLSITLGDQDGSETFTATITGVVPAGTRIFGAGGVEITPDGTHVLTQADILALNVLPPLHFSTANNPDIVLTVATTVTDTGSGGPVSQTFTDNVTVKVTGVADKPANPAVSVMVDEDQPITIGASILAAAGGSLQGAPVRVDNDGSETVSIVLEGVPAGVIPTSATVPGGVTFIGSGKWQVTEAALADLVLPPVPNFSGSNPYPTLQVSAVSQELDSDQATSDPWPISIDVKPVIDAATIDGFSSWNPAVTVTEDNDIPLSNVTNHVQVDTDGSEVVLSYTFDLSNLIADAQIAGRLQQLEGPGAGLDEVVNNYMNGVPAGAYNSGASTITVTPAQVAGLGFAATLFLDSNVDFQIPVSALLEDTANLSTGPDTVQTTETNQFRVDLVGDADTPTVGVGGPYPPTPAGTPVTLNLSGTTTDIDADDPATAAPADGLGRAQSEEIYYVLEMTNFGAAGLPDVALINGGGNLIGISSGVGSWILSPAEIADVNVITSAVAASATLSFELTTVAIDDGDVATNNAGAQFDVIVTGGPGGDTGTPPEVPVLNLGDVIGTNEDVANRLTAAGDSLVERGPGDTTSNLSVVFTLPAGVTISGATFNPVDNTWVAPASAVDSGAVQITPPTDFSGDLDILVEGFATNADFQQARTGQQTLTIPVDPVADGVAITAAPAAASEDAVVDLNISLGEVDTDGNEVIEASAYVRLDNGATLLGGYSLVTAGDPDATVDGVSVVGFFRVPQGDVGTLQIQNATHVHGDVNVDVVAVSREPLDDADGDHIEASQQSFAVNFSAVADAPAVVAAGPYTGNEDTAITLAGLGVNLVDADGSEVLSVVIRNVPEGSMFSAGSNNGDGSWTIPAADVNAGTLTITPPLHYSGTMSLVLEAFTLELSNGDSNSATAPFTVTVAPVADDVEILARDVSADTGVASLDLNVRMTDERGTEPGEDAPEQIEITFSSVPDGVSLTAGLGGLIEDLGGNQWRFTGSEAQANDLALLPSASATAGTTQVSLSAVTIDGAVRLGTPVTDSFQLTVPTVLAGDGSANALNGGGGTELIYGEGGGDTLNGGGGNDFLSGGTGIDILTGGTGSDTFGWVATDLGAVDQIADFDANVGGDKLDVSQLLIGFDPATSALSDFVEISAGATDTLRVDRDGSGNAHNFQDVATFDAGGQSADDLRTNGNLIV